MRRERACCCVPTARLAGTPSQNRCTTMLRHAVLCDAELSMRHHALTLDNYCNDSRVDDVGYACLKCAKRIWPHFKLNL